MNSILIVGSSMFIEKARRWRKVLGGGMRQVGILAAAGKIALTDNIVKLKEDHQNAIYLAKALTNVSGVVVDLSQVQTNMVFVKVDKNINIEELANELKQEKILITPSHHMRLVTHLDISVKDIDAFVNTLEGIISKNIHRNYP